MFFFYCFIVFFYLRLPPPLFGVFLFIYYYDGRNRLQHAQHPETQRREIKGARDIETCLEPVVCFFFLCSFFLFTANLFLCYLQVFYYDDEAPPPPPLTATFPLPTQLLDTRNDLQAAKFHEKGRNDGLAIRVYLFIYYYFRIFI